MSAIEEADMLNVRKIIGLTFGSYEANSVNFKMLQTILLIFAHHLEMLEQTVDIRVTRHKIEKKKKQIPGKLTPDEAEYEEYEMDFMGEDEKEKRARKEGGAYESSTSDESDDRRAKKSKEGTKKKSEDGKEKRARKEGGAYESSTSDESDDRLTKKSKESTKKKVSKAIKASDDSTTSVQTSESKYDKEISVKMSKDKKKSKLKRSRMADDEQDLEKEEYGGVAKTSSEDKEIELIPSKRESSDDTQSRAGIAVSATASKDKKDTVSVVTKDKEAKGSKDEVSIETVSKATKASKDAVSAVDSPNIDSASIELVTRSQFELLAMDVEGLIRQTEPVPAPSMPDNKMIKEALSKGTTTLPGSMEAVQLNARVRAAEQALARMSDLLKAVADSGALPPEMRVLVDQLDKDYQELKRLMPAGERDLKSGGSQMLDGPEGMKLQLGKSRMGQSQLASRPSAATTSRMSTSIPPPSPLVTHSVLSDAIHNLKNEITQNVTSLTGNSTVAAAQAVNLVKSVQGQLLIALAVNGRINDLEVQVAKNAEQLSGFDSGLSVQMRNFEGQVKQMRTELKGKLGGLTLENRVENAAVMRLKSSQERMESQVHQTLHYLRNLYTTYRHLNGESSNLLNRANMVYDEKVNREELKVRLKKKVNKNRLQGLLMDDVFEVSRNELNNELETCFEKFQKRDKGWLTDLGNLLQVSRTKAPLLDVHSMKHSATGSLRAIRATLCKLELMLGDPEMALLTRQLSRNAYCGSCMIAAQMDVYDKSYGKPPELPKLILDHYLKDEEEPEFKLQPIDNRKYICKRWVGGSHTIITEHKTPEKIPLSELQTKPVRYFAATADDGRIYRMQEELEPCIPCTLIPTDDVGTEDQSPRKKGKCLCHS